LKVDPFLGQKISYFSKYVIGLYLWRFVDIAIQNILIDLGFHQHVVHYKTPHALRFFKKFTQQFCTSTHPTYSFAFDTHVCALQPPSF